MFKKVQDGSVWAVTMRPRRATIPDSASLRCRPIRARLIAVRPRGQASFRRSERRCSRAGRVSEAAGMGASHSATKALAKASITMARIDLWHAQLVLKALRLDQREAIAEAAEG